MKVNTIGLPFECGQIGQLATIPCQFFKPLMRCRINQQHESCYSRREKGRFSKKTHFGHLNDEISLLNSDWIVYNKLAAAILVLQDVSFITRVKLRI